MDAQNRVVADIGASDGLAADGIEQFAGPLSATGEQLNHLATQRRWIILPAAENAPGQLSIFVGRQSSTGFDSYIERPIVPQDFLQWRLGLPRSRLHEIVNRFDPLGSRPIAILSNGQGTPHSLRIAEIDGEPLRQPLHFLILVLAQER